jgi:multisubunit Na+/H+ antiporter MnhE subunit
VLLTEAEYSVADATGMKKANVILASLPEFVILWVLWMGFVSNPNKSEIIAGLGAALVAAVADGVVKSRKFVEFVPQLKWLALIFLEPWYALEGTWEIFVALGKRIAGKPSEAEFKAVDFDVGGDDEVSQARRALAITYFTIPPNFVVIGIDRERRSILVHQVSPTGVPLIAKKLGAKE